MTLHRLADVLLGSPVSTPALAVLVLVLAAAGVYLIVSSR